MNEDKKNIGFLASLAAVLAHSVRLELEQEFPAIYCSDFYNGSDPPAPRATESTAEMLKALQQNLPGLLTVMGDNLLPYERKQLEATRELSPEFTKVQSGIERQRALAQAESDRDVVAGPGRALVMEADKLSRDVDPEFYKTREATGAKSVELLNSIDLTPGLSGSERAEVDRYLARNSSNETGSNIKTVENAMTFGSAGAARDAQKQTALSTAIAGVSGALPALRSGMDPFQVATGKSSGPGVLSNKISGVGNAAQGLSESLFGQIGENQRTAMGINANRRDGLDRFNETMGGIGSVVSF